MIDCSAGLLARGGSPYRVAVGSTRGDMLTLVEVDAGVGPS